MFLHCTGHDIMYPDIVRADNCLLYDSQGNDYLDMESGVWSLYGDFCVGTKGVVKFMGHPKSTFVTTNCEPLKTFTNRS